MSCKLVTCSSDGDIAPPEGHPTVFNNEVSVGCVGGLHQCSIPSSYPSGITFNSVSNVVVVAAGIFSAPTQAAADSLAIAYGQNFISNEAVAGRMVCGGFCKAFIILKDNEVTNVLPNDRSCENIQYLNGKLFYCSYGHSNIFTSSDGLSWVSAATTLLGVNNDAAYGAGVYVVVGDPVAGNFNVYTSPDGSVWTRRNTGIVNGGNIWAIVYGAGKFVAGGDSGFNFYSTDGINWTSNGQLATHDEIYRLRFLNGKFYALLPFSNKVYSSPDGITWTLVSGVFTHAVDIAYGNGVYVMAVTNAIKTSPDGITWTTQAFAGNPEGLSFGNGVFCAVTAGKKVLTSPDGVTWTDSGLTAAAALSAVVYFQNGTFVAAEG